MIERIEPERVHELTESIVIDYLKSKNQGPQDIICVDIEGLVKEKYGYRIIYETIAEDDTGKVAFSANGQRPLKVRRQGQYEDVVFNDRTIVLDKYFRQPQNSTGKRFALAHELGHKIYASVSSGHNAGCYRTLFDKEKEYTIDDFKDQFDIRETEANHFGCGLLMPRFLLVNTIRRIFGRNKIRIYGEHQLLPDDVMKFKSMTDDLGVSWNMLYFQLKEEKLIDFRSMDEFLRLTNLKGAT